MRIGWAPSPPFSARFIRGIDANRTLKDEFTALVARRGRRRRISVTDLVNPRQAFFSRTHPEIQPSPDKLQTMMAGTGFHELFGRAVSTEEFVEQFVEFEGVVGKIDVFEDVPVELKTTSSVPQDIALMRPAYLDQLGMYCVMTGRPHGHLILYKRTQFGRAPELKVLDVGFEDPDRIHAEMMRRRDLLHDALDRHDPSALPRCDWFERKCDYGAVCQCEGAPVMGRVVARESVTLLENAELAAALMQRVGERRYDHRDFKINDLVFPRKSLYEKQPAEDEESRRQSDVESLLKRMEKEGFKDELEKAMLFGRTGAFRRIPVALRSLRATVGMYLDVPTLFRSTKFPDLVERRQLAERFPHIFDRLAFDCALAGAERGRVILYYERLPGDKFMVYDVWLSDLEAISAEADRRLDLLERGADPAELPACPPWMTKFCKYAPGCGCGADR